MNTMSLFPFLRTLQGKLFGGFLVIIVLALVVGLIGYFQTAAVRDIMTRETVSFANTRYETARLGNMIAAVNSSAVKYGAGDYDPSLREELTLADSQARLALEQLEKLTSASNEERAGQEVILAAYDDFFRVGESLIAERDSIEAARASLLETASDIKAIRGDIKTLVRDRDDSSLETGYLSMAYHEKEFLWQY